MPRPSQRKTRRREIGEARRRHFSKKVHRRIPTRPHTTLPPTQSEKFLPSSSKRYSIQPQTQHLTAHHVARPTNHHRRAALELALPLPRLRTRPPPRHRAEGCRSPTPILVPRLVRRVAPLPPRLGHVYVPRHARGVRGADGRDQASQGGFEG